MPIILFISGLLAFVIHLFLTKKEKTKKLIIEYLISYLISFVWGLGGIILFCAYVFFPYTTSNMIGWQKGFSPFEYQVGLAHLSFGILSLLAMFLRMKHFWLAIITGYTIFLWGTAIIHLKMILSSVVSSTRIGLYFYHDIFFPIVIIGLFMWLLLLKKEQKT